MFKRLAAAFVVACSVWPVSGPYAADFHVSQYSFGARAWQGLPLIERLELLTKEGLYVFIKGPITQGDHATLVRIHALVPVHTLMISSPGGSVAEALKIAEFVNSYLLKVETDWTCEGRGKDQIYCGCASSCAFIWLAAPLRAGAIVKMHRPYFEGPEFHKLPDAIALQKYNEATSGVRSLLQSRGYSQEFLGALFRIPRERAKELTPQEAFSLPIDVALDELVSARCYRGNEEPIRRFEAIEDEINRLKKEATKLASELPQVPGYELERDPLHARDFAKLTAMWRRIDGLTTGAEKLRRGVYGEFLSCKRRERIQASLRKSGQRLTPEVRSKIGELVKAIGGIDATALIAKYLPDHPFGREAAEELTQRQERIKAIWQDLQKILPATHRDFIVEALK
jgi:hypothetical protein